MPGVRSLPLLAHLSNVLYQRQAHPQPIEDGPEAKRPLPATAAPATEGDRVPYRPGPAAQPSLAATYPVVRRRQRGDLSTKVENMHLRSIGTLPSDKGPCNSALWSCAPAIRVTPSQVGPMIPSAALSANRSPPAAAAGRRNPSRSTPEQQKDRARRTERGTARPASG
jgi:hypothetical protein